MMPYITLGLERQDKQNPIKHKEADSEKKAQRLIDNGVVYHIIHRGSHVSFEEQPRIFINKRAPEHS